MPTFLRGVEKFLVNTSKIISISIIKHQFMFLWFFFTLIETWEKICLTWICELTFMFPDSRASFWLGENFSASSHTKSLHLLWQIMNKTTLLWLLQEQCIQHLFYSVFNQLSMTTEYNTNMVIIITKRPKQKQSNFSLEDLRI